jgi:(1->4)-alpha-D-glucan 1-alpha-D-glucosylmutase
MRVPRATYRIQLNAKFTFRDATALVPYLARLGISHVYCSPYFKARPGSMHGYDVVDHNRFNPEIGTTEDFDAFVAQLRAHGMGHIVDFVPNHVGVGADNAWWMDVLESGPSSRYARFFDIDWSTSGKLLIPVLGDTYGTVLERGELELRHDPSNDSYSVFYHEHRFPIWRKDHERARALLARGSQPAPHELHELLENQAYRLAYWRVAADEINYRRFFDVNELAALRMEHDEVFDATHRLLIELVHAGKVDGLRIDHPDGLHDPARYFEMLQEHAGPIYLLVEKILASFERLPQTWRVQGTTGYNFTNVVNGLFVDCATRSRMDRAYRGFIGESVQWRDIAYEGKQLILDTSLAAELKVLTDALTRIARADPHTRDFTANSLREALNETIACFPVYRTYVAESASSEDLRFIDWAIAVAKRRSSRVDALLFDFLRKVLVVDVPEASTELRRRVHAFAMRFQQVTAPVTAKGVEDTALYRFHRLSSLNEVGGDPDIFGVSVRAFHADARYRAQHWPHEMLSTSTHDTKRAEDVRARINVLSEMTATWRKWLARWSRMNRGRKREIDGLPAPGPNQEYLLYQTLLGTWPLEPMDESALGDYRERIEAYMLKASREAKTRTSWSDVSAGYEEALVQFIRALLEPREGNLFFAEIQQAQARIARFGMLNSLSQTLCKLTAPGVPDIYQGNELWDLSLVDPDNRRPVDYELRSRMLEELTAAAAGGMGSGPGRAAFARSISDSMPDGRAKLFLTATVLAHRHSQEALYREGEYLPCKVTGAHALHICAFARRHGDDCIVVIAPRLFARLAGEHDEPPLGPAVWGDTAIEIPARCPRRPLRNLFDGTDTAALASGNRLIVRAGAALAHFPVALLCAAPA